MKPMSVEENKANNRRFYEEVWNQGKLDAIDELCTATCVFHDPSMTLPGPDGLKQYVAMYRRAFPDTHFTIEDEIAEEEKIVTRWTVRGTHLGELQGIPPTGKQVVVTGIVISQLVGGKLQEGWSNFDALGMLQQMGVIPSMG
jgi:steroid delta-isomerase-like uncharacterized protein